MALQSIHNSARENTNTPDGAVAQIVPLHNWLTVLDALRGAAALYVVCNHASVLLLISYNQAAKLDMPFRVKLMALCSYLFAFGHQSVILFFVLSGFVIHLRQAHQLRQNADKVTIFDLRSYVSRRLRRIVPPFYFALLLTSLLDLIIRRINPLFVAPGTGNWLADNILVQHNNLPTLIGNVLFLQWLKYPTWGNNTPLWSLAYEFYFYLLYPVFLQMRFRVGRRNAIGLVFCISTASMLFLLYSWHLWFIPVLAYWFSWVIGAWGAEIYVNKMLMVRPRKHLGVVLCLGVVWLGTVRVIPTVISDTLGAAVCVLFLLFSLRFFEHRVEQDILHHGLGFFSRMGKFSYSLYLTHVPVLAVIWAIWFQHHQSMPTQPCMFLIGIVVALTVGWVSYQLVEHRFVSRI